MLNKRIFCRVSMAVLAWTLSFAIIFAQTARPTSATVTVTTGMGGDPTVIELLDWNDGVPTSVGVLMPDLEYFTEEVDLDFLGASSAKKMFVDSAGWEHYRLLLPAPTGVEAYEVRIKMDEKDSSRARVEYHPVDQPSKLTVAEIVLGPGTSPEVSPNAVVIIAIGVGIGIGIVIWGCGKAQTRAMRQCLTNASVICSGSGGVQSASFFGICGQGSCQVNCFQ